MSHRHYYPLFADLSGRRCVVVGGGAVAHRKVTALIRCGAQVVVISPTLTARLAAMAAAGRVQLAARSFQPSDVRNAWLVIAATSDPAVNAQVSAAAAKARIFANVVDDQPLCSFIAPSWVRRGALTIAVSTGGASPTLAKRLRRELAQRLGPRYTHMVRLLGGLRQPAKRVLPTYQQRQRYFDDVVSGKVFTLVQSGDLRGARREALELLNRHQGS